MYLFCPLGQVVISTLFHPGRFPNDRTYVDDVANVTTGNGSEVQDAIVKCALAFLSGIVVKRKFILSNKPARVAGDKSLTRRVAAELATYGITVQVADATRDVGIMFTAGASRDFSLAKKCFAKAQLRNARIIAVSEVTPAARKLFTIGAYLQGTWGHQCTGVAPPQL